jgi:dihydrofolate reductase
MISIIAAMDGKRGIGKDGGIPWHIPEDFKRFKKITLGHPMIMGRRTFESIGRILPGRVHIVITRDIKNKIEVEGLEWTDSLESAVKFAKKQKGSDEIFVIGGGQIYKEALEKGLVDKLYLTRINGDYRADTFFPDYTEFKITNEKEYISKEYKYKFIELEK